MVVKKAQKKGSIPSPQRSKRPQLASGLNNYKKNPVSVESNDLKNLTIDMKFKAAPEDDFHSHPDHYILLAHHNQFDQGGPKENSVKFPRYRPIHDKATVPGRRKIVRIMTNKNFSSTIRRVVFPIKSSKHRKAMLNKSSDMSHADTLTKPSISSKSYNSHGYYRDENNIQSWLSQNYDQLKSPSSLSLSKSLGSSKSKSQTKPGGRKHVGVRKSLNISLGKKPQTGAKRASPKKIVGKSIIRTSRGRFKSPGAVKKSGRSSAKPKVSASAHSKGKATLKRNAGNIKRSKVGNKNSKSLPSTSSKLANKKGTKGKRSSSSSSSSTSSGTSEGTSAGTSSSSSSTSKGGVDKSLAVTRKPLTHKSRLGHRLVSDAIKTTHGVGRSKVGVLNTVFRSHKAPEVRGGRILKKNKGKKSQNTLAKSVKSRLGRTIRRDAISPAREMDLRDLLKNRKANVSNSSRTTGGRKKKVASLKSSLKLKPTRKGLGSNTSKKSSRKSTINKGGKKTHAKSSMQKRHAIEIEPLGEPGGRNSTKQVTRWKRSGLHLKAVSKTISHSKGKSKLGSATHTKRKTKSHKISSLKKKGSGDEQLKSTPAYHNDISEGNKGGSKKSSRLHLKKKSNNLAKKSVRSKAKKSVSRIRVKTKQKVTPATSKVKRLSTRGKVGFKAKSSTKPKSLLKSIKSTRRGTNKSPPKTIHIKLSRPKSPIKHDTVTKLQHLISSRAATSGAYQTLITSKRGRPSKGKSKISKRLKTSSPKRVAFKPRTARGPKLAAKDSPFVKGIIKAAKKQVIKSSIAKKSHKNVHKAVQSIPSKSGKVVIKKGRHLPKTGVTHHYRGKGSTSALKQRHTKGKGAKEVDKGTSGSHLSWLNALPWPLSTHDACESKGKTQDTSSSGDVYNLNHYDSEDVDSNFSSKLWRLLGFPEIKKRKSLKRRPANSNTTTTTTIDNSHHSSKVTKATTNTRGPTINRSLKRTRSLHDKKELPRNSKRARSFTDRISKKGGGTTSLKRKAESFTVPGDEGSALSLPTKSHKTDHDSGVNYVTTSMPSGGSEEKGDEPSSLSHTISSWILHPFSSSSGSEQVQTENSSHAASPAQTADFMMTHSPSPSNYDKRQHANRSNKVIDVPIHVTVSEVGASIEPEPPYPKVNPYSHGGSYGYRDIYTDKSDGYLTTTTKTITSTKVVTHDS